MTQALRIAICQIEPVVGDIAGNVSRIDAARQQAGAEGADLAVFCELVVCGYPPEDLVQKPSFQAACRTAVEDLAARTADGGPAMIIGAPWREGEALYNCAFLLDDGEIKETVRKVRLPNYGVFDEPRRFTPGTDFPMPVAFRGSKIGLMVCEDMWIAGAGEHLAAQGADFFIVPHGSPYRDTALDERTSIARERVQATGLPLLFVNQLAGQDEVVFDGAAFVMNADGEVIHRAAQFSPGLFMTEWAQANGKWQCTDGPSETWYAREEQTYRAVTLGVRDYVEKNRFPGVVIGLSGGVDSALTAAIAVDALGPDRVRCVMMPSRYTSTESLEDALACAKALGVDYQSIDIEPAVSAFDAMLAPAFTGRKADTTEENIQARSRGLALMGLSNKTGEMVVSTGNKSEMSVGYATLYGDMCGGFSVLKDVYKMTVFSLCHWRNDNFPKSSKGPKGKVIPERIITKPPSAELKPDQTDQDTLPPYEELDAILGCLIERDLGTEATAGEGHDLELVKRIWRMLLLAEYKRRQAPPGVKITHRSFGRDRRYPITNGFRES